jgi:Tol biopolymer transport system component
MIRLYLIGLLIWIVNINSFAQELDLKQARRITHVPGEHIQGTWSPDGQSIAFQTDRNGSWDIYCYSLPEDSVFPLIVSQANVQNPEWYPDGQSLVFDSDTFGLDYLFVYQLDDKSISPLFKRKIQCKEASFPPSPRQVYFTGYDKVTQEWQIYSYDFIYDNLNQLTRFSEDCSDPQVAPDGKHVVYYQSPTIFGGSSLPIINWYGDEVLVLDSLKAYDPCWDPTGLKVYFISELDNEKGELYSIWKNETHLERLTFDSLEIKQPAISPDGRYLVVSQLDSTGSCLVLIELDSHY